MAKAKVKLGLKELSAPQKIQLAKEIVAKMTGNATFPNPTPLMGVINNGIAALDTAITDMLTARDTAQQKTLIATEKESALDALLTQEASYVETTANGDEQKIISAGMSVRSSASSSAPPAQVQALAVTAGDNEGSLDAIWEPVRDARSYTMEISTVSGTGPWTHAGVVTKSSATLTGQTPGQRVWLRVSGVGAAGQGPWSDPATKIVP